VSAKSPALDQNHPTTLEARAEFFKALGHPSRVLIVNLCRTKTRHTEELSAILGITPATTSHHVKQLEAAGILEGVKDGYYQNYSVKKNVLEQTLAALVTLKTQQLEASGDTDGFRQKTLNTFFKRGRLRAIPAQRKKRDIVLEKLLESFEFDRAYPEREVNQILAEFHEDFFTLRRELIGAGLMTRQKNVYSRIPGVTRISAEHETKLET
jgi:ArsR family transcriptional regulator, arsenate/arsenite/antimonite-responsive transcriptional repressor